MVQRLTQFLEQSVTADLMLKVERGEPLELEQAATTQALQFARIGELYVLDTLEAEQNADELFEEFLKTF